MSRRAVSVYVHKTYGILYEIQPFHRTSPPFLKANVPESKMARFQRSACFLGFALIALQGALAVESPDITHQSPEHAPPIPYLNIMSLFTTSQINRSDSSVESGFSGSIFHKRQREEDGNGGLLCKKAPCPDKRSVLTLQSL